MAKHKCPNNQQLQDFALGKGSMALMERIALHLEMCDRCSDSMDSIDYASDELLEQSKMEMASEESIHSEHSPAAGYTTHGSLDGGSLAGTVIGGDESLSNGDTVSDASEFID